MARVTVDRDYYDRVVDAFRDHGVNFAAVAKVAGIARKTAKKAWNIGWPNKGFAPIAQVIELEELEARAQRPARALTRMEELRGQQDINDAQLRAAARRDAVRARADEARMVRAARASAINLLEATKLLTAGLRALAPKVGDAIASIDLERVAVKDVDAVARIVWRLSISARAGSATAWQILQAERLLLGQPTDIVSVTGAENLDEAGALRELEEAAKALERVKRRRQKKGDLTRGKSSAPRGAPH